MFSILVGALFLLATLYILAPWFIQTKDKKWLPLSLCGLLLIFAGSWYLLAGRPEHIFYAENDVALRQISQLLEDTVPLPPHVQAQIDQELVRQELRSGAQPTVWLLQAQLAMQQNDYAKARAAYAQAYAMEPQDADIAVSYAQTWYLTETQVDKSPLSPKLEHFLQTLQQEYPNQEGLINLLGVAAFHSGDYNKASQYWQELLSHYPSGSSESEALHAAIEQAKQMSETNSATPGEKLDKFQKTR
ncbi:MAG: tetratricopeptide repeat protein [Gammaproteobacteria bacterium]